MSSPPNEGKGKPKTLRTPPIKHQQQASGLSAVTDLPPESRAQAPFVFVPSTENNSLKAFKSDSNCESMIHVPTPARARSINANPPSWVALSLKAVSLSN